jgi:phosphoribosyl-AMP cyclohydrolase
MESLSGTFFRSPTDLIAAIVQDSLSGQVLMMAWMNEEALTLTMETGRATFWSRSRKEIWVKGATSGNTQEVESISVDCDGDVLLLKVRPNGVACHTGEISCFHRPIFEKGSQ